MSRPRLNSGAVSSAFVAHRMIRESTSYRTATPDDPKAGPMVRWRAQGSARTDRGEVVTLSRMAPTKAAAEAALRAALAEKVTVREGVAVGPNTDVRVVAQEWRRVAFGEGSRLSVGSQNLYGGVLDRWVLDLPTKHKLAGMAVSRVKPSDVFDALEDVARLAGPGMARTARTVYRHVFAFAVRQRAIEHNPVREAEPVRAPQARARRPGQDPDVHAHRERPPDRGRGER